MNKLKYWIIGSVAIVISLFLLTSVAQAVVCNVIQGCTGHGTSSTESILVASSSTGSLTYPANLIWSTNNNRLGVNSSTPTATLSVQGTAGTNPFTIASSTGTSLLTVTQSGAVGISDGANTAGNLSLYYLNDTDSGFYRPGANEISFVVGGAERLNLIAQGLKLNSTGTAALPDFFYNGDANTGIYHLQADNLGLSTNGTNALFIDSSQRVGIGTAAPAYSLQVSSAGALFTEAANTVGTYAGSAALLRVYKQNGISGGDPLFCVGSSAANDQFCIKEQTATAFQYGITTAGQLNISGITSTAIKYTGANNNYIDWSNMRINSTSGQAITLNPANVSTAMLTATSTGGILINTANTSGTLTVKGIAGTLDIADFASSSGTSALRITQAGNVGIGTTSPTAKLQIATGADTNIMIGQDSGATNYNQISLNGILGEGTSLGLTGGKTATPNLYVSVPSGGGIVLRPNGGVGAPQGAGGVTITGNNSNIGVYNNVTTGNYAYMSFQSATSTWTIRHKDTEYSGALQFFVEGSSTPAVVMQQGGNVGIGTTTPATRLHVYGSGSTDPFDVSSSSNASIFRVTAAGNVGINNTPGSTDLFQVKDTSGTVMFRVGTNGALSLYNTVAPVGGDFSLSQNSVAPFTSVTSGAVANTLYLKAGNVGIGTTTPAYKLAVTGTVQFPNLTTSAGLQTGVLCVNAAGEVINDSVACLASSKRFKNNIKPLNVGLDEVLKLNPVSFLYKPEFNGALQSNPNYNGQQVGFIAEDVQKIDPRLVVVETEGKDKGKPHSVRYENMTALLAKAIQEMEDQIIKIFFRLNTQDAKIQKLEQENAKQQHQLDYLQAQINDLKKGK